MPPARRLLLLLLLLLAACERDALTPPPTAPPVPAPSQVDRRFEGAIASAGMDYRQWGRVEEQLEVALVPCSPGAMGPAPAPRVRISHAPESRHDKKLFYLWASDRVAYTTEQPIAKGFAIVKESFRAIPVPAEQQPTGFRTPSIAAIHVSGKWLSPGEATGLFVITKVGDVDGTDEGWIYGTLVDGAVTSAGRVTSCMGCHEGATHERLFGLPSS